MAKATICGASDCEGGALPFSEPPRCSLHVEDLNAWSETAEARAAPLPEDTPGRADALALAQKVREATSEGDSISEELWEDLAEDLERRESPQGRTARFSYGADTMFFIAVAVHGIVTNAAYDGLKALLRRIGRRIKQSKFANLFGETVSAAKYEDLRQRQNPGLPPGKEPSADFVLEVELKYRVTVRE